MSRASSIRVSLVSLPSLPDLEAMWRGLEARSDHSFFTSWSWIGNWLECLPPRIQPELLKAEVDDRIVGLGVLVGHRERRLGFVHSRELFLNRTGDPTLDELTVQHNGILSEVGLEQDVDERCLEFLVHDYHPWDECFLDGVLDMRGLNTAALDGARLLTSNRHRYHYVDLRTLRNNGGDYLESLGKNTRYNIRRSLKEYRRLGEPVLEEAGSVTQALEYLEHLSALHQSYWRGKGLPGSFSNGFFDTFHSRLVETRFDEGVIQLLRVRVGDVVIGYLYNFVYRGRVYNYQTGLNYDACEIKNRPGLVCHAFAVEHNMRLGSNLYEFGAGDGHHKRRLGTGTSEMLWLVLRRDHMRFQVEDGLRALWSRLRKRSAPEEESTVEDN